MSSRPPLSDQERAQIRARKYWYKSDFQDKGGSVQARHLPLHRIGSTSRGRARPSQETPLNQRCEIHTMLIASPKRVQCRDMDSGTIAFVPCEAITRVPRV